MELNHETGLFVSGADAVLESTIVRDSQPLPTNGLFGRGVTVEDGSQGEPAAVTMSYSVLERSHEVGLALFGSTATILGSRISDTSPRRDTSLLGDGICVVPGLAVADASVSVDASRIERSARAGISSFGSNVVLRASRFECNAIDLDGESVDGTDSTFDDQGENVCGCDGTDRRYGRRGIGQQAVQARKLVRVLRVEPDKLDAVEAPLAGQSHQDLVDVDFDLRRRPRIMETCQHGNPMETEVVLNSSSCT